MIEVYAERLFTGKEWVTDATVIGGEHVEVVQAGRTTSAISAPLVLPGLVDAGLWAEGYLEGPGNDAGPFAPEEGLIALCRAHGVTSIIDIGSSTTVAHWLVRSANINAVSSLGRICGRATRRCDLVTDMDGIGSTLECLRALGATHVVLADLGDMELPDLGMHDPIVRCRQRGGVTVPGFGVSRAGEEWVAPQATVCSLWTVEDMLNGPDATLGRAFLPYLKHFEGQGNFMARRIARGVLGKFYGERRTEELEGWPATALTGRASSAFLASSGAGAAGVVPGMGLWSELAFLEEQLGFDAAVRAATGNPSDAFPSLNAGVIEPGRRMDLLLCDRIAEDIGEVRRHLRTVVVAGRSSELGYERELVQSRCVAADRRAI